MNKGENNMETYFDENGMYIKMWNEDNGLYLNPKWVIRHREATENEALSKKEMLRVIFYKVKHPSLCNVDEYLILAYLETMQNIKKRIRK
jgi:DNA-directed RNA polymerase subunit L